jgi:prenyltransferase beta subunit
MYDCPFFRQHRRNFLQAAAAVGLASALPSGASTQQPTRDDWCDKVINYLSRHARPDGGYGWDGQERSHLTPSFAVIGCYKLLGEKPPRAAALAEFVRTHHPRELKKLEQEHRAFDWQQIQGIVWLGEDVSSFRPLVEGWKAPTAYLKQYEQHGYPVFQQEVSAILCHKMLGLPMSEMPRAFFEYLDSRRRKNGSFNSTPASDGTTGNVLNVWWGLQALDALGRAGELKSETIAWLQACQLPSGGFTHQPQAEIGELDDVAYTWAAVRSLALLGAKPLRRDLCLSYLHSLWTSEGGFSDRPRWLANPLATYYALDALTALGELQTTASLLVDQPRRTAKLPDGLKVFSIQIEAHGQGSPTEAVDLADKLKIHLWAAKNARPDWLARARAIATERNVPTEFCIANEEYGTWIDVPGLGTYSHMSDIVAPAGGDIGPSLANQGVVSWSRFHERRLLALAAGQGRLVWQFGENEPLVRMLLDDALGPSARRGGFAAISTFHFGNPDFTNSEPFLMRYRGQLPFVALQDAHGTEPWWFADMTEGFRTLFLATQPTWNGWLEALDRNWVAAVRHDAVSGSQTWMHGMPEVLDFVRSRGKEWQWWANPDIERPLVSVVAIQPQDVFEVGRPGRGLAIRVRCAHENTTQGLPKKPLAEFVRLVVDGQLVEPQHVVRRRPNGAIEDDYYLHAWPDVSAGKHVVIATVRRLATNQESSRSMEVML